MNNGLGRYKAALWCCLAVYFSIFPNSTVTYLYLTWTHNQIIHKYVYTHTVSCDSGCTIYIFGMCCVLFDFLFRKLLPFTRQKSRQQFTSNQTVERYSENNNMAATCWHVVRELQSRAGGTKWLSCPPEVRSGRTTRGKQVVARRRVTRHNALFPSKKGAIVETSHYVCCCFSSLCSVCREPWNGAVGLLWFREKDGKVNEGWITRFIWFWFWFDWICTDVFCGVVFSMRPTVEELDSCVQCKSLFTDVIIKFMWITKMTKHYHI